MAFKFMPTIWTLNISANDKLVLLCIADFSNDKGKCWPSFNTIAKKCGLSRSTVIRSVKKMTTDGFLKKDNSNSLSNNYTLNIKINSVTVTPPSSTVTPGGVRETPGVVSERHQGSVTVTPQSINEPVNKKQSLNQYPSFEKFWAIYPIKKSKQKALGLFKKLNPDEQLLNIMLEAIDLQRQEKELKAEAGVFCPEWKNPDTWLRNKCWEDEVDLKIIPKKSAHMTTAEKFVASMKRMKKKFDEEEKTNEQEQNIKSIC
jgi:hypothetical protein